MFNLSSHQKRVVIGSWLGWSLDGYDMVLMLFVVSSISTLFFPSENVIVSMIAMFATYIITLIMRPFGGAIFGNFGDKYGRKNIMIITIIGFSVCTFATGLLPTWNSAGFLAPVLLIILRLLQGLFAGGEWGSGTAITMETVRDKYRGFFSGFLQSGFPMGFIIASVTFQFISYTYPGESFLETGWRIMFFTGIVPGLLALLIRLKMNESKMWLERSSQEKIKTPLTKLISEKKHRKNFFLVLIITTGLMYSYYASIGFVPTFFQHYMDIGKTETATVMIGGTITSFIGYIVVGMISQIIGRKKTLMIFAISSMVLVVPLSYGLVFSDTILERIVYVSLIVFLVTSSFGVIPAFVSERFPTEIRNSAAGFVFNGGLIVGSWAPIVSINLFAHSDLPIPLLLSFNILIGLSIILVGAKVNPDTKNNKL